MTSWCHGAAGIALSRLAALPILDFPEVRQDIAHGLQATRLAGTEGMDTLCCGAMGRVEVFVVAAKKLGDPAYLTAGPKMASSVLRRSRREGRYSLGGKKLLILPRFTRAWRVSGTSFCDWRLRVRCHRSCCGNERSTLGKPN